MNEEILKIKKLGFKDLKEVTQIYHNAFKKSNRFSIFKLLFNSFKKNADIHLLLSKNSIKAFLYTINYENMSFILYLAVKQGERDKGYGSYLLKWYLKDNSKIVFANIDEIDTKFSDNENRIKRLNFYIKNGFHLTKYLSVGSNSRGHIITNKESININEYIKLDKKISKLFFTAEDKIEEKNTI